MVYLNFPCQAEWEDLVQCPPPLLIHLNRMNHLGRVQAALIGMNATGRTITTIRAAGCAGGLGRDSLAASLANLLDGLPGLDADVIAAMIRDLPMPNDVEVPGLTVEEAIEV